VSALTFHGGRIDAAALRFPHAPTPWLDLSTGINPHRWSPALPTVIDHGPLPSVEALVAMERAAARAFGAADLAIAALPGSEIGLRLLATLDLPQPIRVVARSYRTHAEAWREVATIDPGAIADVKDGILLLANPNNPDGRLIPPDDLVAIGRRMAARGGVLIVDEAFADALPDRSIVPLLREDDRILVLRSFGKMFGLAGVRLGFAIGARDLVTRIAAMLGSWPVSATAIALGTAAYDDADWQVSMRERLAVDATARDAVLRRYGLTPRGACPLFTLVETEDAAELFERLGRAGILVRLFDDAPHRLRFGLPGGAEALHRLDAALDRG
jgi:cobalamin biosynthetic protein CobC